MSVTPDRWRQIEDLYHAARGRCPADRAALLELTDPDIRARVERMLALDSGSQIPDLSPGDLLADPTKTVIVTGTQLGPYQIEAQIGAGGMGTVNFAPRIKQPVLMVNGRYDFTFSVERSQNPLFQMLGTPQADKRHVLFDTPHDISQNKEGLSREVLAWLDKYLGRVNRSYALAPAAPM